MADQESIFNEHKLQLPALLTGAAAGQVSGPRAEVSWFILT